MEVRGHLTGVGSLLPLCLSWERQTLSLSQMWAYLQAIIRRTAQGNEKEIYCPLYKLLHLFIWEELEELNTIKFIEYHII